jgi:hypothetical protein
VIKIFFTIFLLLISEGDLLAQSSANQCTFDSCKAGTKAITYHKKSDPYYACPTRELATYVTMVTGLVAMQASLGVMPNISDKTGEPEYQGETKALVDSLRTKAHVTTFGQALNACEKGVNKKKVTVMNMPTDSLVTYVYDEKRKAAFWMPISHLDRLR